MPQYEKTTTPAHSRAWVEAVVQEKYLEKCSVLRSYKLALFRLYDIERRGYDTTALATSELNLLDVLDVLDMLDVLDVFCMCV